MEGRGTLFWMRLARRRLLLVAAAVCLSSSVGLSGCTDAAPIESSTVRMVLGSEAPLVCTVPARLRGAEVSSLRVNQDVVALTFDAGANADGVASILSTLRREHVAATFFLTGDFVNQFPRKSKRIASGYLIGNHTMSHMDLTRLTDKRVARQIRRAQATLIERAGQDPRRYFRFPFGARDARTIKIVNDLCYVPFRWTVDTLGWKGTSGGSSVDSVVARVIEGAQPGEIVLMHAGSNPTDGSTLDADALPTIIDELRGAGYSFVDLAAMLPDDGARTPGS